MSNKPLARLDDWMFPVIRDEFKGPFDDLFNNMMNRFFGDFGSIRPLDTRRTYPKVDIYKDENDLVFEAAVPGMKKEHLTVDVNDGVLTIKGDTCSDSEESKCSQYIKELKKSSFVRRFILPDNIQIEDMSKTEASLEDGILKVIFKDVYKEEVKPEPKITNIPIK
jgi:HSP20 family protein